jgi:alcohol dehydrogenase
MENFTYYSPVKFLFGKGQIDNLAEELKIYGKKILFVYGQGHIKKYGVYDKVITALKDAEKDVIELSGVHPNPRIELVRKGIEMCKKEEVDFILAVGGGSVSDTAKAIAVGVKNDFEVWDMYEDFLKQIPNEEKTTPIDSLPFGVVITKSGTGSEFDLTSVQTNEATNEKLLCMNPVFYPKFAILDPTLTYTLPADETAYGIADMMTHYFEQYFVLSQDTSCLDNVKEGMLRTIIEHAPKAVKKLDDYTSRSNIMYAGAWSCSAQNITGVIPEWSSHFIEHEITALCDLNHGLGMAIIMPAWMKYVVKRIPGKFAQFAENIWGIERKGRSDEEVGLEGINKLQDFWKSLGIPTTFTEAGVDTSILPKAAKRAVRFGPLGTVAHLEEKDVLNILELAK